MHGFTTFDGFIKNPNDARKCTMGLGDGCIFGARLCSSCHRGILVFEKNLEGIVRRASTGSCPQCLEICKSMVSGVLCELPEARTKE